MTEHQPPHVIFQCDGAELPAELLQANPNVEIRSIRSRGTDAEIDLQIHELYRLVMGQVKRQHADLVRLAAYVYRADLSVSRGKDRDTDAWNWKRRMDLCIPVTEPDRWNEPQVRQALAAALNFLTDDLWTFSFSQADSGAPDIQLELFANEQYANAGVVTLLSGGLDSLCTVIESAMKGERPVPLGHWPSPQYERRQQTLIEQINALNGSWQLPLIGVRTSRRGEGAKENTQRTRGFLYGCLASAVAAEIGAAKVYLADNGPISLNLPINDQLVGAMASRATHPQFLYRLNQFLTLILQASVTVSNPLQWRTRPETLKILRHANAESLIPTTVSCSAGLRRPLATPHCGGCSQCIDRRFATIAAGMAAFDPPYRYMQDVFTDPLEPWHKAMTAYSYIRFARSVRHLTDRDILEHYPQLLDLVTPEDREPEQTILEAIDLTRRHIGSVLHVIEDQIAQHVPALTAGEIPAASLLGMVLGEQQGRRAPQTTLAIVEADAGTNQPHGQTTELPAPRDEAAIFAWNGNGWRVTYAAREVVLKPSVGLARLAVLLREPHRSFTPEELLTAAQGDDVGHSAPDLLAGITPESYGSREFKADPQAIKQAQAEIKHLNAAADRAQEEGDDELAKEAIHQVTVIEQYLREVVGLHGLPRTFDTQGQKRGRAVRRSLERGLDLIALYHRPLWRHLDQTIHFGIPFTYAPEPMLAWSVLLPTQAA